MNELELTFKWKNGVSFELLAKATPSGGPVETYVVVKADENAHLLEVWGGLSDVIEQYIKHTMDDIRKEMELP